MAYTILNRFIPSSIYSIKSPYTMKAEYITFHNTANDATAINEISYMTNNRNATSYHVAIDDKHVVQAIPFSRMGWHCGDGANGTGNRKSIGIEVCYSKSGGPRYAAAEENAIEYIAHILKERGWGIDRVKWHRDWSGKNCPHRVLDEGRATSVRNRIVAKLAELNGVKVPVQPSTVARDYLLNGDKGPAVTKMQTELNRSGVRPPLSVDGIFGNATENAVKAFQRANNLKVDGIWGKASQAKVEAIIANLNKPKPPSTVKPPTVKPSEKEDEEMLKLAIVIGSLNDYAAAEILSVRRKAPIYPRNAISGEVAKELIVVGGNAKGLKAEKITNLSGGTRFETADNVEKYLKR